jgi:Rrf2 family protein
MIELARGDEDAPVKGDLIASSQDIPVRFLENILAELRHAGLVQSRRGIDGGYWLAKPADQIALADVIRGVEGPLATVHGEPADELEYTGDLRPLQQVWIALRANIREILEAVTLADVASGDLPEPVLGIASQPDVWQTR